MSRAGDQRRHYDHLVLTRRPTRYGVSCGFEDRFDPALLERRPALSRAMRRLFERLIPEQTGTVLDIGCGTAYYWPLLSERCERLVGLDLSRQMVSCGRRYQEERGQPAEASVMVCGAADALPLASGSVDTVLVIDVLHHVEWLEVMLGEARRLLRPGGSFTAVEPNVFNPVVFAAHLIPGEERGAIFPNHPWRIRRALRAVFGELEIEPVTYVSGIESEGALAWVDRVEPLFELPPLSSISLRKIYRARR